MNDPDDIFHEPCNKTHCKICFGEFTKDAPVRGVTAHGSVIDEAHDDLPSLDSILDEAEALDRAQAIIDDAHTEAAAEPEDPGLERLKSVDLDEKPAVEEPTFRCHHCEDTGFVIRPYKKPGHPGPLTCAQRCSMGACPYWRWVREQMTESKYQKIQGEETV